MKSHLYKYRLYMYLILSILAVIGFMIREINPTNLFVVETDFLNPKIGVTILRPQARLLDGVAVAEPLYFKIETPTVYDSVEVELSYVNSGNEVIQLGYQRGEDIDLKDIERKGVRAENPVFEIGGAHHTFVISVPGISEATPLDITNVRLVFKKKSLGIFSYLSLWK